MRSFHRIAGVFVLIFALYLAVTGSWIQIVDLAAILGHSPAEDPNMLAIRESINGGPGYEVIAPPDYSAPNMPAAFDYRSSLQTTLKAARVAAGTDAAFKGIEFRMVNARPVTQILLPERIMRFDALTASELPDPQPRPQSVPFAPSQHLTAKNWHRLFALGDGILWLNALAGIGLFCAVVAGLILYFRLYLARAKQGRIGPFWSTGGPWRALHRGISVVAVIFLLVVSVSGTLLALDSFYFGIYRQVHHMTLGGMKAAPGARPDHLQPLADGPLEPMLATTLAAANREGVSIRALRLRTYFGTPQGVVITGESEPRQLVFNAVTGRRMTMTEPGYPQTGFPFGWEEHELMKRIHRGDAFGLPGRLLDLLAGLSLIYLTLSGGFMYFDTWQKRKKVGKKGFFWK